MSCASYVHDLEESAELGLVCVRICLLSREALFPPHLGRAQLLSGLRKLYFAQTKAAHLSVSELFSGQFPTKMAHKLFTSISLSQNLYGL